MSDKVKLIIEIPKSALELLNTTGVDWLDAEHILSAVSNGVPFNDAKIGKVIEKRGKWIKDEENIYHCSKCGRRVHKDWVEDMEIDYPFCHCGASMREVNE